MKANSELCQHKPTLCISDQNSILFPNPALFKGHSNSRDVHTLHAEVTAQLCGVSAFGGNPSSVPTFKSSLLQHTHRDVDLAGESLIHANCGINPIGKLEDAPRKRTTLISWQLLSQVSIQTGCKGKLIKNPSFKPVGWKSCSAQIPPKGKYH